MNKKYAITIFCLLAILATAGASAAQGPKTIILVSDNEADSGLAEAAAAVLGLEVVTTPWNEYDESKVTAINNLNPETIIIIGGHVAVPTEYDDALSKYTLIRISGPDRYATAAAALEYFKGDFKGKGLVIANGRDSEGIKNAVIKAKIRGTIPVFIKPDEIPDEVESVLESLPDEEVEVVISPDMDLNMISSKIKITTNLTLKHVQKLSDIDMQERAFEQIEEAKDAIKDAEEKVQKDNVTNGATRLLEEAKKHLNTSVDAYHNESYGLAYGQAVSAESLAENAERFAEHEGEGKNRPDAASEAIRKAGHEIDEAEEALGEISTPLPRAEKHLAEAKEYLESAKDTYDEGDYGKAFADARTAKRLAQNAVEAAKDAQKRMHVQLTLSQKKNGRDKMEIDVEGNDSGGKLAAHDGNSDDEKEKDDAESGDEEDTTTTTSAFGSTTTTLMMQGANNTM